MEITAIALPGLEAARRSVESAARRIASPAGEADPAADMVDLVEAGNQYAANLKVIQTAQEIEKRTIDLFG